MSEICSHQSTTERSRARTKPPESTAKIQQCVLVIFSSHHQHSKTQPKMSPLQVVATSALLLACVYLSVGTPVPVTLRTDTEDIDEAIAKRTGTEAINAKIAVDNYIKDKYKDEDASKYCSSLRLSVHYWHLPQPNVMKCNISCIECIVNTSTNLNYLLQMYSYVLGLMYRNNSSDEAELDFLEVIFSRFSNQMQRYLQARNHFRRDTMSTKDQQIKAGNLTQPIEGYRQIANAILCQLRDVARTTMRTFGKEHCPLYGYKFAAVCLIYGNCVIRNSQAEIEGFIRNIESDHLESQHQVYRI